MSVRATIILPTFGRADFIRWPIRSAQQQTISDIEILVIGDGVTDESRAVIGEAARADERISFFDHPKGPRNGELYRHEALLKARGEIVCYLGHDDLWFPTHVEEMLRLLEGADFCHSLFTCVDADGCVLGLTPVASDLMCRSRMIRHLWNRFGPTCAAHTKEFYFKLPQGWRPAPAALWSDLHMWRQFFDHPGCRVTALPKTTALFFPRSHRRDWEPAARSAELARWFEKLSLPDEQLRITAEAVQSAASRTLAEVVSLEDLIFKSLGRGSRAERPAPAAKSLLLGKLYLLCEEHFPRRFSAFKEKLKHRMVAWSGLFNAQFYRGYYPDIPADCGDLVDHFLLLGWKAAKHPSPDFDVTHYLTAHPEVVEAQMNPLVHYIVYGYRKNLEALKLFN